MPNKTTSPASQGTAQNQNQPKFVGAIVTAFVFIGWVIGFLNGGFDLKDRFVPKATDPTNPKVAEAAIPIQFNCVQKNGQWLTSAYQGKYVSPEPMFNWQTTEFGQDFTPKDRCLMVSLRLNQAVLANRGLLDNLMLQEGDLHNQKVICVQDGDRPCDDSNLLFTLSAQNAQDPKAAMAKMANYAQNKAGSTIYENGHGQAIVALLNLVEPKLRD